jgi:nicotinamide mononucleotide (NMN) deamidase PncC
LLQVPDAELAAIRPSTEAYAMLLARKVRAQLDARWGIAETGAAGPAGNRYGDPAGHACTAIAGPVERARTLATGRADRVDNMRAFASGLLELLLEALES